MKKQKVFSLVSVVCFFFYLGTVAQSQTKGLDSKSETSEKLDPPSKKSSKFCKDSQVLYVKLWHGLGRGGVTHDSISLKQNGQFELFHSSWFDDSRGTQPAQTVTGVLEKADFDKLFTILNKYDFFTLPDINNKKLSSDEEPWQQFIFCHPDGRSKKVQGDLSHSKYSKITDEVYSFFHSKKGEIQQKGKQ